MPVVPPKDSGCFVTEAELPGIQMRHEDGLCLVKPEHTVYCKDTCHLGQE